MNSWLSAGRWRSALAMLVALLIWVAPATAADISGTVEDLSGSAGRVYLKVLWTNGGETSFGTSIDLSVAPEFTIRGVQDGEFVVSAFSDEGGLGLPLAWGARGISEPFQVATENVADVAVTINYPENVPATGVIQELDAMALDGAALLFWGTPQDEQSGFYLADSFTACWDTDPTFSVPVCYLGDILATSDEVDFLVDGLESGETGQTYYFQITPSLDGIKGAPTTASAFIAPAATGGATVSGTVTFNDLITPEGTPVYVFIYNENEQNPQYFFGHFDAPAEGLLSFAIPGVADGSYGVFALADLNENGLFDLGDAFLRDADSPLVTVQGVDVTGVDVVLSGSGAYAGVSTTREKWLDEADTFSLSMEIEAGTQQPVAVTLIEGPDGPINPVDIGLSSWGGFDLWLNNVADQPQVGDSYTFDVTYADDSTGLVEASVTGVLDSFPTLVSPIGPSLDATQPTFTWQAPADPPQPFYSYEFLLWEQAFNYTELMSEWDLSSDQTSIGFSGGTLSIDTPYLWSVAVRDRFGNSARIVSTFTPVTELPALQTDNIGVFRAGKWYLDLDGSQSWTPLQDGVFSFGMAGDLPLGGDWNGDGGTGMGVFRAGTWYLDASGDGQWGAGDATASFGMTGDIPAAANWTAGGGTEIAVFRAGKWYVDVDDSRSWNLGDQVYAFGLPGDIPVPADWNGDGLAEMAVFRGGKWYVDSNGSRSWDAGDQIYSFGLSGDLPVVGDWNGDGTVDLGVFRAGKFYLDANDSFSWDTGDQIFSFGSAGDIPFAFRIESSGSPE
jgi:uncharacterized protein (DUF2141 family)